MKIVFCFNSINYRLFSLTNDKFPISIKTKNDEINEQKKKYNNQTLLFNFLFTNLFFLFR